MSDFPISDRINEIMNTSQTAAVMDVTPRGSFEYFIREYEWKACELEAMRSALNVRIAEISVKIDECRNTASDFRDALGKLT